MKKQTIQFTEMNHECTIGKFTTRSRIPPVRYDVNYLLDVLKLYKRNDKRFIGIYFVESSRDREPLLAFRDDEKNLNIAVAPLRRE